DHLPPPPRWGRAGEGVKPSPRTIAAGTWRGITPTQTLPHRGGGLRWNVLGEAGQRVDAPARNLAIGRYPVIGQAIPRREGQLGKPGVKKSERRGEPRHPPIVAADMQPRPDPALPEQRPDRCRVMPLGRAEQRDGAG